MGGSSPDEFPLLSALGLYAADIRGDGNCLFNALSDQIYGDQTHHADIRACVIDHMREHAAYYKQFIDVHPGGGVRRNPKRKNAGAYSSSTNFTPPTDEEINNVFETHLARMARGGTWGDNMEITAFAAAYNTDVKIYQRDFAYMVTREVDGSRPVAHIAYHIWEHYSSIRNVDGPHTGMPAVNPHALSPEEEAMQREKLAKTSPVMPWQIDVVKKSLPYLTDTATVKRALEAAKGDVNTAVSNLLDSDEFGSASSQQESSSVEREQDSDDDQHGGPNKKQDRRMSRASRALKPRSAESKHALSQLAALDGSQESVGSWESEVSSNADSEAVTRPTSIDDSSDPRDVAGIKTETSATDDLSRPKVKLKLLPPKPPKEHASLRVGKAQYGPRLSARDRKDMKKQAQKAARKERQQASAKGHSTAATADPSEVGLAFRQKGMTGTPPVETLRTLYI